MQLKDLKVGKYYELKLDNKVYLFKIKEIFGERVVMDKYYICDGVVNIRDHAHFTDTMFEPFFYKQIVLEDIIKYLPRNHPDIIYMRNKKIKQLLCL